MSPIRRDIYCPLARIAVDLDEVNSTMEAAWTNHLAAKRLIERFRALKPREVCKDCGGVGMKVSISLGTPVPCAMCRPEAFAEFFAALAYEYEVLRPLMAEEGGYGEEFLTKPSELFEAACRRVGVEPLPADEAPPTQRSEPDPWDLPADEQLDRSQFRSPPPPNPYRSRERDEWDEHDDKIDIQPFTRTTRY